MEHCDICVARNYLSHFLDRNTTIYTKNSFKPTRDQSTATVHVDWQLALKRYPWAVESSLVVPVGTQEV